MRQELLDSEFELPQPSVELQIIKKFKVTEAGPTDERSSEDSSSTEDSSSDSEDSSSESDIHEDLPPPPQVESQDEPQPTLPAMTAICKVLPCGIERHGLFANVSDIIIIKEF